MINKKSIIFLAGHNGMVGSSLLRNFKIQGFNNVLTASKHELNLLNQKKVQNFIHKNKIDCVVIAAARTGGIKANDDFSGNFLFENMQIQNNLINQSLENNIKNLIFLGSSCVYPNKIKRPIVESDLLTGSLEKTNEGYALAKIAGVKLCELYNKQYGTDYRSIMPSNLYGPKDNFNLLKSHVIPALILKFHLAKINNLPKVLVWGDGKPRREFLYVNDLALGCLKIMKLSKKNYQKLINNKFSHINIGTGIDISIDELSKTIKNIVGYKGKIIFDKKKPNGTMRKVLDISLIKKIGWKPKCSLKKGLDNTYKWFIENNNSPSV